MTAPLRTFLPWCRSGYATALGAPPAAGQSRAAVAAGVRLRGEPDRHDVPLLLAGPGDVLGLDPQEVLRTEPFDGSADYEPAYFPYVEFKNPDLPWRFTPRGAVTDPLTPGGATQRQFVPPWLALVVVPADTSTLTPAAGGAAAVLRCPAAELPDPAESWAWAHVQVTHAENVPVAEALATPGTAIARLLCPRLLEAGVQYRACVVPTFDAGRAALLGSPAPDPLGPAWGPTGDVELPAYLTWSFRSGPDGTFESLVRRLRPRPVPSAAGRTLDTTAPGWGARTGPAGSGVLMQGAMRPAGTAEAALGDPALAESLRAAVSGPEGGTELRPPLYGQDHQHGSTALAPGATGWLAELNTDPRRRVAAGLAAWAVTVAQEELADEAWRQLAEHGGGRPRQADAPLAAAVTASLSDRHTTASPAVSRALAPAGSHAMSRAGPRAAAPTGARAGAPGAAVSAAVAPVLARLMRAGGPLAVAAPAVPTAVRAMEDDETDQDEGLFAPRYPDLGYTFLRAVAPEWLLPGLDALPTDSVALAETNPAFVESFVVGLNHALARELQWRRFPLRADRTFVDAFWGPGLPPLETWDAADGLGSHAGAGDQLVLLLRGALLRRFPTAAVFLERPAAGTEEQELPVFTGRIGTDCAFLGFRLTAAEAVGGDWTVVVQESVGHARFGADEPGENPPLASWQDLTWSHPHLAGHRYAPVAGALTGVSLPVSDGATTAAVWGLDAANQAAALQQPAFRVTIPIALWLNHPTN